MQRGESPARGPVFANDSIGNPHRCIGTNSWSRYTKRSLIFLPRFPLLRKLKDYSELVVLPHSVFALPFALVALLAATGGRPSFRLLALVVAAMVFARTAAMAYNRFADARIDAKNPRTQGRPIPSGRVHEKEALFLAVFSSAAFIGACALLNPLALVLSPVVLAWFFFYSHTKRFTWLSHFVLGLALGAAPPAAWIAAKGELAAAPLWLTGAVVCFVAGFDILYALWDEDFDRKEGLHSFVVRFGARRAVFASRLLHGLMLGFLAGFGRAMAFPSAVFWPGVVVPAVLLAYQHARIVRFEKGPEGSRPVLSKRLFALNGWVAVAYFLATGVPLCF